MLQYFFNRSWVGRVADQWFDVDDRASGILFCEGREQLQDEVRAWRKTIFACREVSEYLAGDTVLLKELGKLLGNNHYPVAAISANNANLECRHEDLLIVHRCGWLPPHIGVEATPGICFRLVEQSEDLSDEEAKDITAHVPTSQFQTLPNLFAKLTHHAVGFRLRIHHPC